MGTLALGLRKPIQQFVGQAKVFSGTATGSATYATGGEIFPFRQLGLVRLDLLELWAAGSGTTQQYVMRWNNQTSANGIPRVLFLACSAIGDPLVEETAGTSVTSATGGQLFYKVVGV